ncbi:MAG: T9SS type A sorting domain-containing protein [Flavobacteriales bacterium]|nr:T9SS type A sorting domain-containing protein [Flavobacteriales bacterium]
MKKIAAFSISFLFLTNLLLAQQSDEFDLHDDGEYITPIHYVNTKSSPSYRGANDLVYILDTLELPFIDDFSFDYQKKYWAVPNGNNVIDSVGTRFLADGVALDTIAYMFDTSFSYVFNGSGYDTLPNQSIELIRFDNFNNLNLATDTQTVWPACEWRIEPTSTIKYDLVPDSVAVNTDTLKFVPDDNSLWLDVRPSVYINNGMGIDPPTIGVATFDGLDHRGNPYNISAANINGEADTITSKPIDLDYLPGDSVYLSFYYQSGGNGNEPEFEDSLILEFYNVLTSEWDFVWSVTGQPASSFVEVIIPIINTDYLQNGFQFRFRNFATLSGAWDVWNLDYVYLDKNRSVSNSRLDASFLNPIYSYVKNYSAIPWDHYNQDPASQTIDFIEPSVYNFSSSTIAANSYFYEVFDQQGNSLFNSDLLQTIPGGVPGFSSKSEPLEVAQSPNNFSFPVSGPTEFTVITSYDHSGDINKSNDTLKNRQIFDTYYAYDDGTAETAYTLVGVGAKGAQQFSMSVTDTLKGVSFYFPTFLEDASNRIFNINIYKSLNPEDLIYTTLGISTTTSRNELVRFAIEDTDLVLSGTFYVGWEQTLGDQIYIGMDRNTDNMDKIFWQSGGSWANTSFTGSLFIHPDFGEPTIHTSIKPARKLDVLQELPILYPNPADEKIRIGGMHSNFDYNIFDMQGKFIQSGNQQRGPIDISNLRNGLYFIELKAKDKTHVLKFLVEH